MTSASRSSERALDHAIGEPTLSQVLAELRELRAVIEQRLAAPPQARQWLTVDEASDAASRSPQTIRAWCRGPYRIGTRVKNRWQVDRAQLRRIMIDRFGASRLPHGLR